MAKLHGNAGLTESQRREVRRLYEEKGVSQSELARRFCVHRRTIERWVRREASGDRSSAPHTPHRVVTEGYRAAVVAYRQRNPHHGPIRMAHTLQADYPEAHRGTIYLILCEAGLSGRGREKKESVARLK